MFSRKGPEACHVPAVTQDKAVQLLGRHSVLQGQQLSLSSFCNRSATWTHPFQVGMHHEPLVRVGVVEDEPFNFFFLLQDIVHPLEPEEGREGFESGIRMKQIDRPGLGNAVDEGKHAALENFCSLMHLCRNGNKHICDEIDQRLTHHVLRLLLGLLNMNLAGRESQIDIHERLIHRKAGGVLQEVKEAEEEEEERERRRPERGLTLE